MRFSIFHWRYGIVYVLRVNTWSHLFLKSIISILGLDLTSAVWYFGHIFWCFLSLFLEILLVISVTFGELYSFLYFVHIFGLNLNFIIKCSVPFVNHYISIYLPTLTMLCIRLFLWENNWEILILYYTFLKIGWHSLSEAFLADIFYNHYSLASY